MDVKDAVVDEKYTGVYDAEKQPTPNTAANPHFPGKTNEYAIEVAPAGSGAAVHDAVFGDMDGHGPNYRAVSLLPW
jgi:hypothetical protein